MRSFEYADAVPEVSPRGNRGVTRTTHKRERTNLKKPGYYFLKSLSKASRASLALRGGGVFNPCGATLPLPGTWVDDASRATVTLGENTAQAFA